MCNPYSFYRCLRKPVALFQHKPMQPFCFNHASLSCPIVEDNSRQVGCNVTVITVLATLLITTCHLRSTWRVLVLHVTMCTDNQLVQDVREVFVIKLLSQINIVCDTRP